VWQTAAGQHVPSCSTRQIRYMHDGVFVNTRVRAFSEFGTVGCNSCFTLSEVELGMTS